MDAREYLDGDWFEAGELAARAQAEERELGRWQAALRYAR
jgi:hypothetical protein